MTAVQVIYYGKRIRVNSELTDWGLLENLKSLGLRLEEGSEGVISIFVDFTPKAIWRIFLKKKAHRILLVFEPRAVNPLIHKEWFQSLFGLVLVFSSHQLKPSNVFVESGGWNVKRVVRDASSVSQKTIACAFGNKVSLVSSSNYSLRHDLLVRLGSGIAPIYLAGPGWESFWMPVKGYIQSALRCLSSGERIDLAKIRPPFSTKKSDLPDLHYVGWVEDEVAFYSQHGCVLVVENDVEFLSEKVFHAIASGRPVVYSGPGNPIELEKLGVICCPPDADQIAAAAKQVIHNQDRRRAIPNSELPTNAFLELHSVEAFYERVAREVAKYIHAQQNKH